MDLIQDYTESNEDTAIASNSNNSNGPDNTNYFPSPQHLQYTIIDGTPNPNNRNHRSSPIQLQNHQISGLSRAEINLQTVEMVIEENNHPNDANKRPVPQESLHETALHLNEHFQHPQHIMSVNNQIIEFEMVINDGSNESSVKLIALKNIFSKQLPKMPKEYIVRLVFDKRHLSLAIKKNSRIIGGICYRPYNEQHFGEIAFCAVSSQEQVRGFGTKLMNQLKFVAQRTGMEYFLTYADNYAIGYFQKQGFSKHISMPKERWVGFIKDYDGGTLMEGYVHPGINYLDVNGVVSKQRKFILERLQESSRANIAYPGLTVFQEGRRLQSVLDLPGVVEGKWSNLSIYRGTTERDRTMQQSRLHGQLKTLFEKIKTHKSCRQLLSFTIDEDPSIPDSKRLDYEKVNELFRSGDYYRSKEALGSDLLRMLEYYRKLLQQNPNAHEIINSLANVVKEVCFDQKDSNSTVISSTAGESSNTTTAN